MAQDKNETPTVASYADHEVITPPNRLQKAVAIAKPAGFDPIARAEEALGNLASEFSGWMDQECEQLDEARQKVKAEGFAQATRDSLFRAAHDIKGEAATFGFPLVAPPAESLCRLIEHTPDMARIPLELVDQHVDTIRAIVREGARSDIEDVARALTRRLRDVTDEFLRHENRDRPDVLKIVMAPSLVPGGGRSD
jgi:HPt (histidine-containing phosphotransfer) domain-containing protein